MPFPAAHLGKILVVDDDRLVLATVVHGLSKAGYEVIDADNGDDAILLAREHRPELALLDIRMEGKSGFDVAETLRDAYRIPFMFLSAFADEATLAKVQALGALDYLTKPLDVGQILPRVADAFARLRGLRREDLLAAAGGERAASAGANVAPSLAGATTASDAIASAGSRPIDPVALAVGVLMHRHSLTRQAAMQRLVKLATDQRIGVAAQADRLLDAIEELARTGG